MNKTDTKWVTVPMEPTDEMALAGRDAVYEVHSDGVGTYGECGGVCISEARAAWAAMLAAAPKAEPARPAEEYPALPEPDIHYRYCDSVMRYMDAQAYSETAMRAYGEACWKDAYKHAAWGAAPAAPAAVAGPEL